METKFETGGTSFRVLRNGKKIAEELSTVEKGRVALLEKYGGLNPETKLIEVKKFQMHVLSHNAYPDSVFLISKAELSAWSDTDVSRMDCWLGPNNEYYEGFTTINDLIAYNRYTSVSRLMPELLFLGSGNPFIKWPTAGFYLLLDEDTIAVQREVIGLTVDVFKANETNLYLAAKEPTGIPWDMRSALKIRLRGTFPNLFNVSSRTLNWTSLFP
jgi:hypothetical protein